MTAEVRLTPLGRTILDATRRGRVSYLTGPQVVIQRTDEGPVDVSPQFSQLTALGFAYIQPYDVDQPPVPVEVPGRITQAGEDALMEAARAAKQKKAGKR